VPERGEAPALLKQALYNITHPAASGMVLEADVFSLSFPANKHNVHSFPFVGRI
jgi:hypothetical protein